IVSTRVHASGCSFSVVSTSWASRCCTQRRKWARQKPVFLTWAPSPVYMQQTTLSRRLMSNFWEKSSRRDACSDSAFMLPLTVGLSGVPNGVTGCFIPSTCTDIKKIPVYLE
ncbi:unnamed protein product, partial [Ixodes pacificus]